VKPSSKPSLSAKPSSKPSTKPSSKPSTKPSTEGDLVLDSITTDKATYTVREKIVASFTIANPAVNDYVGVFDCNDNYIDYLYTCGGTTENACPAVSSGSVDLTLFEAGCYYVGIYAFDDTELAFTQIDVIQGTNTVATDKTSYTLGENVVISYQSNPANPEDFVSVWNCADTENYGFDDLDSQTSGTFTFLTGPGTTISSPGCYIAYLQDQDTEDVYAQSAEFNIA